MDSDSLSPEIRDSMKRALYYCTDWKESSEGVWEGDYGEWHILLGHAEGSEAYAGACGNFGESLIVELTPRLAKHFWAITMSKVRKTAN